MLFLTGAGGHVKLLTGAGSWLVPRTGLKLIVLTIGLILSTKWEPRLDMDWPIEIQKEAPLKLYTCCHGYVCL